jgi:hypothetical protein
VTLLPHRIASDNAIEINLQELQLSKTGESLVLDYGDVVIAQISGHYKEWQT